MAEVIELDCVTRLDIPVERVVEGIPVEELKAIVIVAEMNDGDFYFASNKASGPEVLWLLEEGKYNLMRITSGF